MSATNTSSLSEKEAQLNMQSVTDMTDYLTRQIPDINEFIGAISDDTSPDPKRLEELKKAVLHFRFFKQQIEQIAEESTPDWEK